MCYRDPTKLFFTKKNSKIIAEKTKTWPIDEIEINSMTMWSFGTEQVSLDQRTLQVSNETVLKLHEKGSGYINKDFIIIHIEQGIIPGIEKNFQGFKAIVKRVS